MIKGSPDYPAITGEIGFYQTAVGVLISVQVTGLPSSNAVCGNQFFGFHIHSGNSCTGNADDPFANTRTHYDPNNCDHPYHPSYIGRLVKKYTGCSLHEYIIRAKLKYATRLLMNNELSVTEIAYKLGFCSSSHFGSIFKAHTGVNPLQFRHEMRECDIAKQAAAHNGAEADNDNKG